MVLDGGVEVQGTWQEACHWQEEHGVWIQKIYRGLLDLAATLIPLDHVTFLCLSFPSVKWFCSHNTYLSVMERCQQGNM